MGSPLHIAPLWPLSPRVPQTRGALSGALGPYRAVAGRSRPARAVRGRYGALREKKREEGAGVGDATKKRPAPYLPNYRGGAGP